MIGSRVDPYFYSGPQGGETKVSLLEFVSISPGTALEIKYKYLVGPDKKRERRIKDRQTGKFSDGTICSTNGPVFHVFIGATRIGAQQGPLTDYPSSKCRNRKRSVANGCRTCWSPEQTLLIEVDTQVSGQLDLHIKNNARYLLLQPASVITIGTPPPWSKVSFSLFPTKPAGIST